MRTAPAKKRKQSTTAGISSFRTKWRGLPQFSASRSAYVSAWCSIESASFSSRLARSAGVVRDQVGECSVGGPHRFVDLVDVRFGDFDDHFTGARISYLFANALPFLKFRADEKGRFHNHLRTPCAG